VQHVVKVPIDTDGTFSVNFGEGRVQGSIHGAIMSYEWQFRNCMSKAELDKVG
jgi:hypothetical protein